MTGAERIETILAEQRCRDVHGDTYTPPFCESCRGWAAHVAALVAAETGGLAERVKALADELQAKIDRGFPHFDAKWMSGKVTALLVPDQQPSPGDLGFDVNAGYTDREVAEIQVTGKLPDQQTSEGSER